jgi:hypothetical protein
MRVHAFLVVLVSIVLFGAGAEPARIEGGDFEASAVAYVPNSNDVLVVDDQSESRLFLIELGRDGAQTRPATPIALHADVVDPEGITYDGHYYYVVGSQSKKDGEGDGLVRFVFDARTREIGSVERIQGLGAWLAGHVAELRSGGRNDGLDIEGLAWDPLGQRLLLGLRAPVVDGSALVVPVRLQDPKGPFARENLRLDGESIRVSLDGDGIRSLEYDAKVKTFRIIAGASGDRGSDFRLLEWDGRTGSRPRPVTTFPEKQKPEGITRATLDQRPVTVIVFDTGRFAVAQ